MKTKLKELSQGAVYLCLAWVALEGLFFLAAGFGWETGLDSMLPVSPFAEKGWGLRLLCLGLGVLLVKISVLGFLHPWLTSAVHEIHLENQKGNVWLSSRTISDYIQRKSEQIEEVESLKVKVNPLGENVSIQVDVSLRGETPLPEVTARIQSFIEKELKETIGIEKVEGIHIHFKRIGGLQPALPAPESPEQPRKPIDGKSDALEPETVDAEIQN